MSAVIENLGATFGGGYSIAGITEGVKGQSFNLGFLAAENTTTSAHDVPPMNLGAGFEEAPEILGPQTAGIAAERAAGRGNIELG